MRKQKIPYAVAHYGKIVEDDYYYVDKTRYIEEIEKYEVPVFLRPRRFGKSLFCSTLEHYYDLRMKDRFQTLFGDKYIGQHPTGRQNSYMVLSLNFSKIPIANTIEELERNFCLSVNNPLRSLSTTAYKEYFEGFQLPDTDNSSTLFDATLNYIRQNNLPQLYLIIDEYDNFTNQLITAHNDMLYSEVTTGDSFLRTFFKVIKAGVGEGSIGGCFITGVLPITMDDLTSGFNIAEMVTLQPNLVQMLGFNYDEAREYLEVIFGQYGFDPQLLPEIWRIIISNYDGYRLLPGAEPIFNSTILTYFIKNYTLNGAVPDELIDENVRTDVNWIKRLTQGLDNAREMLDTLLIDGQMVYSRSALKSRFNREQFFRKDFYPISLYYLGMTTLKDDYLMTLPNNTLRSIFVDYYNILNDLSDAADRYAPIFIQYLKDRSMDTLFGGYYNAYLGQFAAQTFDKINENFVRNTFYELCVRYLSNKYTFSIEQNYPSGRCDWEMTGIPGTPYHGDKQIVEFKYYPSKDAPKIRKLSGPTPTDVEQINAYANDMLVDFPYLKISKYVIYVMGNKGYRLWKV